MSSRALLYGVYFSGAREDRGVPLGESAAEQLASDMSLLREREREGEMVVGRCIR